MFVFVTYIIYKIKILENEFFTIIFQLFFNSLKIDNFVGINFFYCRIYPIFVKQ